MNPNPDTIANSAYQAWELQDFDRAAKLFLEAAALEDKLAASRSEFAKPNQAFNYELRAGLCLFDSGRSSEARPILEKSLEFDWKAARLWGDRHMTETAITYLLLDLADQGQKRDFQALFDQGIQKGAELQLPFPRIVPNQKKLITACQSLDEKKRCRVVLYNIDNELVLMKEQALRFAGFGLFDTLRKRKKPSRS